MVRVFHQIKKSKRYKKKLIKAIKKLIEWNFVENKNYKLKNVYEFWQKTEVC